MESQISYVVIGISLYQPSLSIHLDVGTLVEAHVGITDHPLDLITGSNHPSLARGWGSISKPPGEIYQSLKLFLRHILLFAHLGMIKVDKKCRSQKLYHNTSNQYKAKNGHFLTNHLL